MIITKNSISQTSVVKETFNYLKLQYKGERIGDIVELIQKATGIDLKIDLKLVWSAEIFSKLLDYQLQYINGEELDLTEMKEYIYKTLEFSKRDITLFEKLNLEERLWAIMMLISEPSRNYFKND